LCVFVKGRTGVGSGDEANAKANALNRQVRRISTTIGCWKIQFGSFSINGIESDKGRFGMKVIRYFG